MHFYVGCTNNEEIYFDQIAFVLLENKFKIIDKIF